MKKKLSLLLIAFLGIVGFMFATTMEATEETEATYPITATWDFQNLIPSTMADVNIQGTDASGIVPSNVEGINMNVSAAVSGTNIKLQYNSQGYAQFNQNTKLQIPVKSTNDVVTVVSYPGQSNYTIGGEDAKGQNTFNHKATLEEVQSGFVNIIASSTAYLYSIQVVQNEPVEPIATDVTANWDWKNLIPETMANVNIQNNNEADVVSDVEGIVLHVISTGGKLQYNSSGYAQFNQNTEIQVPVKNKGDEVTVVSYPGQSNYTVGGEDATGQNTFTHTATSAEANTGYVSIVASKTAYLYSIKVLQKAPQADDKPVLVEKSIYSTTFSDWAAESSTVTTEKSQTFTTKFTKETLTFKYNGVSIDPINVGDATKLADYPGYIKADKNKGGYIETSKLASVTKVHYIMGATSKERGFGLKAKREGDTEWTEINMTKCSGYTYEATAEVNMENCYLRFENLAPDQYAFLLALDIFGQVDMTGAPLLGSFKANGKTYAGDDFEMGNSGNYEATFELFKSETMISKDNPISNYIADNGEIGEITYTGDDDQCTVTIPVTAGEKTVNYVATFVRKPFMTLTYLAVGGKELGTQEVEKDAKIGEFKFNPEDLTSTREDYAVRGWFKQDRVGEKWTTESVVTENITLYAVETEIEVASTNRKYEFNLTDKNFDAADHEAFNPTGNGYYWHDGKHGWAFKNGNTVDLLVGPKATIFVTLCDQGYGTNILVKKDNELLETLDGKSGNDGSVTAYNYEGEAGTVTLEMVTSGEMYIHSIRIVNTAETNYDLKGQWIYVKEGDASSFLDALDAANGMSGTDRVYVYLPNGIYDLGTATKTTISRNNISIIGESMEGVIIKNRPIKEGIDITATLLNTATNTYLQDLTIDCIAPYGTGDDTKSAERGVCFQDKGNQTVMKKVYLKGLQDTYYSNSNSGTYYFEDCKIEGSVDYVCGNGDVYFNRTTFYTVNKSAAAGGGIGGVIAAPNTKKSFGYIFNECTLNGMANEDGKYRLGRPWASGTIVRMLDTKMLIKPTAMGWDEWSTDVAKQNSVEQFGEYNSVNANGTAIDLSQRKTSFKGVANNPVITADEAANYRPEAIFTGAWKPFTASEQKEVEEGSAKLENGVITWKAVEGATSYAIFKNNELLAIVEGTSYTLEQPATSRGSEPTTAVDVYTIRAINAMGGMGEPVVIIDSSATAINGINATENNSEKVIYNLQGVRMNTAQKGVYIINGKKVVMK